MSDSAVVTYWSVYNQNGDRRTVLFKTIERVETFPETRAESIGHLDLAWEIIPKAGQG